jgi:LysR family hydrogen peroxide-inducible transcriptional activator
MTITQLKYVLAVAEYRNFTIASEHCFVTQPTLSMQIQKLEDELDILIFNRNKKPIELTEIGEKIIQQAKIVIDESKRINHIVNEQKGHVGGDFRLGIIPTIMPTLLPLFLKTFVRKYPKITLKIEELTTEQIVKKLNDGNIDAAIAATPLKNDSIKELPIYNEPFVGFVPDDHPLFKKKTLHVNDLEGQDILVLEDGHCFKDNIVNLCQTMNFEKRKFQLHSGSFETLIQLSKEGLGMTLLPYLNTQHINEDAKKNIIEFSEPAPAREVSIIYHKSQLKNNLIGELKKTIDGIIRGVIAFDNVKIVSPLKKELV